MAELPGVVNRWLMGLTRLRERGRFIQPESGEPLLELLRHDADPLIPFLEEECELRPDLEVEKQEFNKELNNWLVERGHHMLTAETIAKRLYAQGEVRAPTSR